MFWAEFYQNSTYRHNRKNFREKLCSSTKNIFLVHSWYKKYKIPIARKRKTCYNAHHQTDTIG